MRAVPTLSRSPLRLALLLASLTLLPASAVGCGGSDSGDESTEQVLELQQAREQGRKEARDEARAKKLAADAAALRKEVADLRKGKTTKGAPAKASSGNASAAAPGGTSVKTCANGITANSVTSCPFAESVKDAYYSSGGSSSVSAYSPTTGQAYAMSCSGSGPVTCRGGNNAQVTFP
jgi:hypothetical protein